MSLITDAWVAQQIILPLLDILVLSFLIYKVYQILIQTRAIQLVKGALALLILYALAVFLNLETVLWLINLLAPGLVIGLAIVFQPELRKIFTRIGQGQLFRATPAARPLQLEAVVSAAEILSIRKRGALMVFARQVGQKSIIETGTRLDANLSSALIVTIFGHETPLHDGAIVIADDRVIAAGCFLPLSEQLDVRRSFGTRHRAALGLSEETGALSLAYDTSLHYDLEVDEIREKLKELLNLRDEAPGEEVTAIED